VKLTADERAAINKRRSEDRKRAEAERKRRAEAACRRADKMLMKCQATGHSDYTEAKGVKPPAGCRFTKKNALAVPVLDVNQKLYGIQFILSSTAHAERIKRTGRNKEFWPSGMSKRGHFFMIGAAADGGVILVVEGVATGCSLNEATGLPVAVAFDAGNLQPVAEALQKRYRRARILICADDDYLGRCSHCRKKIVVSEPVCPHCGEPHGRKNTGLMAGNTAAFTVNDACAYPVFADRGDAKLTDFNDLHQAEGLHVVARQIEAVIQTFAPEAERSAQKCETHGGGAEEPLKPMLSISEAAETLVQLYGSGGTYYDASECALVPKADVLDRLPDHGSRDLKVHPNRRWARLSEVGFDPAGTDPAIKCNLWGGWPTKPSTDGSCDKILELLEYLCSNDANPRKLYKWLLCWLARPIQKPGAKMATALIAHGPPGSGKNLFFEVVMALYGWYGRIIDQPTIEDRFNDWASRKLFMICDEVVARSDLFHIKNRLKAIVTGDWIRINPKNVAAHDEKNHVNLVFMSNETLPLLLESDDRRYTVVWTPPPREPAFYAAVAYERDHGGIAALHQYLLDYDLGEFDEHSKPMMTGAKSDLILLSKPSPERFTLPHNRFTADLKKTGQFEIDNPDKDFTNRSVRLIKPRNDLFDSVSPGMSFDKDLRDILMDYDTKAYNKLIKDGYRPNITANIFYTVRIQQFRDAMRDDQ